MHFTKSVLAGGIELTGPHGTSAVITEQNWSYTTASKLEIVNGPHVDVLDTTTYAYDLNNSLPMLRL